MAKGASDMDAKIAQREAEGKTTYNQIEKRDGFLAKQYASEKFHLEKWLKTKKNLTTDEKNANREDFLKSEMQKPTSTLRQCRAQVVSRWARKQKPFASSAAE